MMMTKNIVLLCFFILSVNLISAQICDQYGCCNSQSNCVQSFVSQNCYCDDTCIENNNCCLDFFVTCKQICSGSTLLYHKESQRCVSSCPEGTIKDPNLNVCFNPCIKTGQVLDAQGNCVNSCPVGYFQNSLKNYCQKCHDTCLTCENGDGASQCTSCPDNIQLFNMQCLDSCKDHYFSDAGSGCQACHSTCRDCVGSGENQCISCNEGRFLNQNQQCVVDCGVNYYNNDCSVTCSKCYYTCKDCSGPTHTECTECHDSFELFQGQCIKDCGGYFFNGQCFACPEGFPYVKTTLEACIKSCAEQPGVILGENFRCVQCEPPTSYSSSDLDQCLPSCFDEIGTIKDDQNMRCKQCPSDKPISNSDKTECLRSCYDEPGTKQDNVQKLCIKCSQTNQYASHDLTQCLSGCPIGHIIDSAQNRCIDCSFQDMYASLDQSQCLNSCPDGTYNDCSQHQCFSCDGSCFTCRGPANNDCLTCPVNHYLRNHQCYTLQQCTNFGSFYGDDQTGNCEHCHAKCKTCDGKLETNCLSCYPTFLKGTTCVSYEGCGAGFYGDESTHQCVSCGNECSTCNQDSNQDCRTCPSHQFLKNNLCTSNCGNGYYQNQASKRCELCHPLCLTCSGGSNTNCLSCFNDRYLQNSQCVFASQCSSGKYPNEQTKSCESCHSSCLTCNGPAHTNCLSCNSQTYLQQNQCVNQCNYEFYGRSDTRTCELCQWKILGKDTSKTNYCNTKCILTPETTTINCENYYDCQAVCQTKPVHTSIPTQWLNMTLLNNNVVGGKFCVRYTAKDDNDDNDRILRVLQSNSGDYDKYWCKFNCPVDPRCSQYCKCYHYQQ